MLDADIYGPSRGILLGRSGSLKPLMGRDKGIEPVLLRFEGYVDELFVERCYADGLRPMASSAVQQILTQTSWGD